MIVSVVVAVPMPVIASVVMLVAVLVLGGMSRRRRVGVLMGLHVGLTFQVRRRGGGVPGHRTFIMCIRVHQCTCWIARDARCAAVADTAEAVPRKMCCSPRTVEPWRRRRTRSRRSWPHCSATSPPTAVDRNVPGGCPSDASRGRFQPDEASGKSAWGQHWVCQRLSRTAEPGTRRCPCEAATRGVFTSRGRWVPTINDQVFGDSSPSMKVQVSACVRAVSAALGGVQERAAGARRSRGRFRSGGLPPSPFGPG